MNTKPAKTLVTAHMITGPVVNGQEVLTFCGQHLTIDAQGTENINQTGDYIVCPLCEVAYELADIPVPPLEQGSLF
ncbi:hypothetical protein [Bifidobacterium sp.]|uniref:hypothetical protein n=1 Tax=Bifidobacterium sp. TaxID=41200 RepID=UPI0025C1FB57|nr:hypothetical protein [Bifidobacterium sp.]MCH4209865.1 hypothetical protein [Bifidobacterium sp.]MCI1224498.1 hypothetical protein [Bifidobacterium sp.]